VKSSAPKLAKVQRRGLSFDLKKLEMRSIGKSLLQNQRAGLNFCLLHREGYAFVSSETK